MKARFEYTPLTFKRPAGTSRGELTTKHSWLILIEANGITGTGECSIIPGLSPDFESPGQYETLLSDAVTAINNGTLTAENAAVILYRQPSVLFGVECAFRDVQNGGNKVYFDNTFSRGQVSIPINGLIWMGNESFMQEQIEQKLAGGFSTIKMKIGAIDFETEFNLLKNIRSRYDSTMITLRVDANGAFSPKKAVRVLKRLAELDIHSIEQPIQAGQWDAMQELCRITPTPIALDEELIGIHTRDEKIRLLSKIAPQFIILKPSLHGGISGTKEWIELAEQHAITWWMTSALESNIGLKAICELTAEYSNPLPQGLGTGSLYVSNFESNLTVENGMIFLKNPLR
ncbi:MAG: o-succinylbenzoate synthase [Crocinitomicaceae bacterium]|nr:o-succinylbenzoate synthase [Crocinitomicaceae bacterium]NGF76439.1 o-succinylbenzoate synthase [Fluviicola sp. SGL-29]